MPTVSFSTLAGGARQLVVQEAFDTTRCFSTSISWSFTPQTKVPSMFLPGAEMMTFLAPASKCGWHLGPSTKRPVHSSTTSTFAAPQGTLPGSFSALIAMKRPSISIPPSTAFTGFQPRWTESFSRRYASISAEVRSLM